MIFFIVSRGYFQGSEAQSSGKVRGCEILYVFKTHETYLVMVRVLKKAYTLLV